MASWFSDSSDNRSGKFERLHEIKIWVRLMLREFGTGVESVWTNWVAIVKVIAWVAGLKLKLRIVSVEAGAF